MKIVLKLFKTLTAGVSSSLKFPRSLLEFSNLNPGVRVLNSSYLSISSKIDLDKELNVMYIFLLVNLFISEWSAQHIQLIGYGKKTNKKT